MNCPHCDTSIHDHEASRCLDAWVAEIIFEFPRWTNSKDMAESHNKPVLRLYSTDIAAAWDVVEKFDGTLALQGPGSFDLNENYWSPDIWVAGFTGHYKNDGSADTAPLAICRAAIMASHD